MLSEHEVTAQMFERFIGGSVEIDWRNQLYYGQLADAQLRDDHLVLSFEWLAKNRSSISVIADQDWDVVPLPAMEFSLLNSKYFDAGNARLYCLAEFIGAKFTFMPADYGSPIAPDSISGLSDQQRQRQHEQYEKFMNLKD